jgi:hypothetical protein
MADLYRQKVTTLAQALERSDSPKEATEALRGRIDAIILTPEHGELRIELKRSLAAVERRHKCDEVAVRALAEVGMVGGSQRGSALLTGSVDDGVRAGACERGLLTAAVNRCNLKLLAVAFLATPPRRPTRS